METFKSLMSKVFFIVTAALLASLILLPTESKSQNIRVVDTPVGPLISLEGDIQVGAADRLRNALTVNPSITKVGLVSHGGSAEEGFAIAEVLSDFKVSAYIPPKSICLSACAFGFMGAHSYHIYGVLGLHNMYLFEEDLVKKERDTLLAGGQMYGVRTAIFYLAHGFSLELPLIVASTTKQDSFIAFTNSDDFMRFFVRDKEDHVFNYLAPTGVDKTWLDSHLWTSTDVSNYIISLTK